MDVEVVQRDKPIEMFLTLPDNNSVSLRFGKKVSPRVWETVIQAIDLLRDAAVEHEKKPETDK